MSKNPLRDLLTGYEAASEHEVKGKRFVSKAISGTVSYEKPSKLVVKLTETARSFVNLVSYTSTRSYGLLLGVFGLLTLMLHFTNSYFSPSSDLSMPVMMLGAVFAILAIPFLSFDKPIAVAMQEFRLTDAVFFEFFCIQRMQKKTTERGLHPALCILLGLALAVLGSLFGAWYVAAGMACATYLYLTAISPEFSFFFVFLAMPYMSLVKNGEVILAVLVAVTVLSFIRKVSQGKRIYYFEQYDFLLLVMLIIVFISGIFIGGISSFVPSLVMLALGFGGYALTGSLVSNRRLADCVIKANIISSLPISFIAIAQLIRAALTGGIAEYGGSDAVFDSPDMLGAFLLISASFMLYFVFVRRHRAVKLTYAVYLLITLMAMATTMRLWLAVSI